MSSFVETVLLVIAAVLVLWGIIKLVKNILFPKWMGHHSKRGQKEQFLTSKDRELLDLIRDLAELYRSTGRTERK